MQNTLQGRLLPIEALNAHLAGLVQLAPYVPADDPRRGAAAAPPFRLHLARNLHFFDRVEQDSAFDIATSYLKPGKHLPVHCVLAGGVDDMPELLLKRFMATKLRRLFDDAKLSVTAENVVRTSWPRQPSPQLDDAFQRLLQPVLGAIGGVRAPEPKELRRAYGLSPYPVVVITEIYPNPFDDGHEQLFQRWVSFWAEVGERPLSKPLPIFTRFEITGSEACARLSNLFDRVGVNRPPAAFSLQRLQSFHTSEVIAWLEAMAEKAEIPIDRVQDLRRSARQAIRDGIRLSQLDEWTSSLSF
jgi:hypothetical protein